jgi:hypothetical protein
MPIPIRSSIALCVLAACSDPTALDSEPRAAAVSISPATVRLLPGDSAQLNADVRDSSGAALPASRISWTSRNTAVALVSPAGLVRAGTLAASVTEASVWIVASVGSIQDSARVVVAAAASAGAPRMGINLDMVNDWSTEWPFTDLSRASRRWIPQRVGAPWGQGGTLALTADNYVASLEPGQFATTIVFTDPEGHQPGGEYVLLYQGSGELRFDANPGVTVLTSSPGRISVRLAPATPAFISLRSTDPSNPIRNISFVGAANEATFRTRPFNEDFLDVIRPFGVIRFMNWQATNYEPPFEWSRRSLPSYATWAGPWGVPVETMVALANEVGADAWFNIPHNATDDYVRQFATMVRDQLSSPHRVYVEYSNELWNGIFPQSRYAGDRGMALGLSADRFQAALRFQSQRSLEIFAIWRAVFGADSARVLSVLASQAGNAWTAEQLLDWRSAREHTDALAIAPYFGGRFGGRDGSAEAGMSETALLDALAQEIETTTRGMFESNARVAAAYGVKLTAYEGGQHLVSADVLPQYQDAVTMLFTGVNRHPRMGELYRRYLELWYESGGDLFDAFVAVASWGRYGSWGALEYVHQDPATSPKYQALLEAVSRFGR